jgi:hypothetical protein
LLKDLRITRYQGRLLTPFAFLKDALLSGYDRGV